MMKNIWIVFLVLMWPVGNFAGKDKPEYDSKRQESLIHIIVKFEVPDIDILTAKCNAYRSQSKAHNLVQEAVEADALLKQSVNRMAESILEELKGSYFRVKRSYDTIPFLALAVTRDTLTLIEHNPFIIEIYEDRKMMLPEKDVKKRQQLYFGNDANTLSSYLTLLDYSRKIGAETLWEKGFTGEGWYVAVLDTGLWVEHEMFDNRNIVEACFSLGEDYYSDDGSGGCPNGLNVMIGEGAAAPRSTYSSGHGSHVTGIAAGDNGNSQIGVAKGANIIAIQVFTYFPSYGDELSWESDQLKALEYIYSIRNDYNIASVNMSLGGWESYAEPCADSMFSPVMDNLKAVGIAVSVSSGNDGFCGGVTHPACLPSTIGVNGTDFSDNKYIWGNSHPTLVDLMAPGVSIPSASIREVDAYSNRSGTSMAAPFVAGSWALMRQAFPELSVDDILESLKSTGVPIDNSDEYCSIEEASPRVNLSDALSLLSDVAPPSQVNAIQVVNASYFQKEYINEITWQSNRFNENKDVVLYRVYRMKDGGYEMIGEVDSDVTRFLDRMQEKKQILDYAVTAVNADGLESLFEVSTLDISGII